MKHQIEFDYVEQYDVVIEGFHIYFENRKDEECALKRLGQVVIIEYSSFTKDNHLNISIKNGIFYYDLLTDSFKFLSGKYVRYNEELSEILNNPVDNIDEITTWMDL